MHHSHRAAMNDVESIEDEIADLESRLAKAKSRLRQAKPASEVKSDVATFRIPPPSNLGLPYHFLLLLSDSQLPVGSFAFSSGLESYIAHTPRTSSFNTFLPLSVASFASTTLPFVLAAHRDPKRVADLDDQLDAAVICTVGRRASVAQGRALLGIWERSFRSTIPPGDAQTDSLLQTMRDFSNLLRASNGMEVPLVSGHLAPLFGVVCAIVGLDLRQTAYVFVMSHIKALVSAAVRANIFGPYQAQKVLAGDKVQRLIHEAVEREWHTLPEDAGQSVPVMDLWIGRHEVLYSRIFNS